MNLQTSNEMNLKSLLIATAALSCLSLQGVTADSEFLSAIRDYMPNPLDRNVPLPQRAEDKMITAAYLKLIDEWFGESDYDAIKKNKNNTENCASNLGFYLRTQVLPSDCDGRCRIGSNDDIFLRKLISQKITVHETSYQNILHAIVNSRNNNTLSLIDVIGSMSTSFEISSGNTLHNEKYAFETALATEHANAAEIALALLGFVDPEWMSTGATSHFSNTLTTLVAGWLNTPKNALLLDMALNSFGQYLVMGAKTDGFSLLARFTLASRDNNAISRKLFGLSTASISSAAPWFKVEEDGTTAMHLLLNDTINDFKDLVYDIMYKSDFDQVVNFPLHPPKTETLLQRFIALEKDDEKSMWGTMASTLMENCGDKAFYTESDKLDAAAIGKYLYELMDSPKPDPVPVSVPSAAAEKKMAAWMLIVVVLFS